MAREFAKSFYNSAAWKKTSKAFASSRFYLCERCGKPYKVVHHKKPITPENINDPYITLSWDNLQTLCQDCHAYEHSDYKDERNVLFDDDGNVIGIQEQQRTTKYPPYY